MDDFKKQAAREALRFIKKGDVIGLGAGATIAHLVGFLREDAALAGTIGVVTASFGTRLVLEQAGFAVKEMGALDRIDLYFDGCDQFDRALNALKSGGGIHTREKILASMAGEFILIGDESKYVERLDGRYPLVVEVIPDALAYVMRRVPEVFEEVQGMVRMASSGKDGAVITENGNYLVDCRFSRFPEPERVNDLVVSMPGVLEHSLFYGLARQAVLAGPGGIKIKNPRD